MNGTLRRLDRLAHRFRPVDCFSDGDLCTKYWLVGDGSDDPPEPEVPATCAACGRATTTTLVIVAGVDMSRL